MCNHLFLRFKNSGSTAGSPAVPYNAAHKKYTMTYVIDELGDRKSLVPWLMDIKFITILYIYVFYFNNL